MHLAVLPQCRGQGVGRALVETAAVLAREYCAEALDFVVRAEDSEGIRFIKHFKAAEDELYHHYEWAVDAVNIPRDQLPEMAVKD